MRFALLGGLSLHLRYYIEIFSCPESCVGNYLGGFLAPTIIILTMAHEYYRVDRANVATMTWSLFFSRKHSRSIKVRGV
jgi:hypothetical protein